MSEIQELKDEVKRLKADKVALLRLIKDITSALKSLAKQSDTQKRVFEIDEKLPF